MIAGAGAVALAGAMIAPGIASAEGSLGSLGGEPTAGETATYTETGQYEISATPYDNCTVKFEIVDLWTDYPNDGEPNFRADYQVDGEDFTFNEVYRPVVVSNQSIYDAIENRPNSYDIALNTATVNLTEARTVPDSEDVSETAQAPGVEANADGTHTVTFGVYQGPSGNDYTETVQVTVTGCPTTDDDADEGNGSLGSLDLFGSLEGLLPA